MSTERDALFQGVEGAGVQGPGPKYSRLLLMLTSVGRRVANFDWFDRMGPVSADEQAG